MSSIILYIKSKKHSFSKNGDMNFYIGKRIFNQEAYDKLCDIRGISDKTGYFPAYRKSVN